MSDDEAENVAMYRCVEEDELQAHVVINRRGIVQRFNRGAESLFGITSKEILTKKVNNLMPLPFASEHDQYLQNYLSTGVRKVIGYSREVRAMNIREDFDFPVRLSVSEIRVNGRLFFHAVIRDIRAEEAQRAKMRDMELWTNRVTNLVSDALIVIDARGSISLWNPAASDMFGYSTEESMGQNVSMLMPEPHQSNHDGYLQAYRRKGVKHIIGVINELDAVRKNGRKFPVELTVLEAHIGNRKIFMGICRDLSALKETEAELTERQLHTMAVIDAIEDSLVVIDAVGTILSVNNGVGETFQYEKRDLVGQNVSMLMPSPYREEHDSYLQNYAQTGIKFMIGIGQVVSGQRKDEATFPAKLHVSEIEVGSSLAYCGIIRDLTQSKSAEERSRKIDLKMKGFMDACSDAIIHIDEAGIILVFNPAAERVFGWKTNEILGRNISLLMPYPFSEDHDQYLRNYIITGIRKVIGIGRELVGKRRDGTTFPSEVSISESVVGSTRLFSGFLRDVTREKEQEAECRSAQERTRAIVDALPDAIITIDTQGFITAVNLGAQTLFGYDENEMKDQKINMLMPSPYSEEHDSYLHNYLTTRVKKILLGTRELLALTKNGTIVPVDVAASEVLVGNQTYFTAILRDVTTRKAHQEALHHTDLKLNGIIDATFSAIFVADESGIINMLNSNAIQQFGYTREFLLGQNVKILMPAPYRDDHDDYLEKYKTNRIQTGPRKSSRLGTALTKDGKTFPVEVCTNDVSIGKRRMFTGIIRDITIRSKLEAEVSRREKIIGTIMSAATDAIIAITTNGIISSVNKIAEQMFGYSQDMLINQNIRMLMPEPFKSRHDDYLRAYLDTGKRKVIGVQREFQGLRADGRVFYAEVSVSESIIGSLHTFTGFLRDITERKEREQQIQEAEKKSQMLINDSNDAMVICDSEGIVNIFNPAASKLFGYEENEVLGENVSLLMPPPYCNEHNTYLERYRRSHGGRVIGRTVELPGKKKDGSTFSIDLRVFSVTVDEVVSFAAMMTDVSERVGINESHTESVQVMLKVLDESCCGCILIDPRGKIKQVNNVVVNMWGYQDMSQLAGTNVKVLMPRNIADKHDGYLESAMKSGKRELVGSGRRTLPALHSTGNAFSISIKLVELAVHDRTLFLGIVYSSASSIPAKTSPSPEPGRLHSPRARLPSLEKTRKAW